MLTSRAEVYSNKFFVIQPAWFIYALSDWRECESAALDKKCALDAVKPAAIETSRSARSEMFIELSVKEIKQAPEERSAGISCHAPPELTNMWRNRVL